MRRGVIRAELCEPLSSKGSVGMVDSVGRNGEKSLFGFFKEENEA